MFYITLDHRIDGDMIDMSLKKTDIQQRLSFDELKVGMLVKGWVKRLDPKFGVFVSLKNCNIVGLCHLSEVLFTKMFIHALIDICDTIYSLLFGLQHNRSTTILLLQTISNPSSLLVIMYVL